MAVAILCVAACGGCASGVTPDTSDQGAAAHAEAGRPEQASQMIDACPVDSGTLIAGLREMSLPCLADAASAVSVTAVHGRPEIINVWASWCVPCRRETALLEDVHRRFGDRVLVLGVDSHDDRAAALQFLAELGATYPQAFDPPGSFALRLRVMTMPHTVFVDASGRIVDHQAGELTPERLRSALSHIGMSVDP